MRSLSFTERCWREIEPLRRAILEHPFLLGLVDGTLPEDRFRAYIIQDSLYLLSYARTLSALAARAPSPADTAFLASCAAEAIAVEQALHAELLDLLALTSEEVQTATPGPTTLAYTSFMSATVQSETFLVGVGSVLPCFWIYAEVGNELARRGSDHVVYRRWIETYGGDEYAGIVAQAIELADRAANGIGAAEEARARHVFSLTSRYEWMFWEAAWREESWPLGLAKDNTRSSDPGLPARA
jgi:thiaminase/transcriptional activator TenA